MNKGFITHKGVICKNLNKIKTLLLLLTVVLCTFSIQAFAAGTEVMYVTNGRAGNYAPGSTVVVFGQLRLTPEGYGVPSASVVVRATIGEEDAAETIFYSAPETNADGFFKVVFNVPLSAEEGEIMTLLVGNESPDRFTLINETQFGGGGGGGGDGGSLDLIGFIKGSEGSLDDTKPAVISVSADTIGLIFNRNVNYFRNGGGGEGFQDLGIIDRNIDCITFYENGRVIPVTIELVDSSGRAETWLSADAAAEVTAIGSGTLNKSDVRYRDMIFVKPVNALKANTAYKLVISRNLTNNNGRTLDTLLYGADAGDPDIELFYTTAVASNPPDDGGGSAPPPGGGGGYIPPSGGGDAGGSAPPATTTVTPDTPANNGTAYTLDAREVQKNTDGSQTLTGAGTLTTDGGTKISLPAGTTVAVNGTITVPATGKAELEMSGGTATINGGATINADGSLITKGNTDIVLKGGTTVAIPANSGISGEKVIVGAAGARTETKSGLTFALRENAVLTLSETAPLGYNTEVELPFTDVGSEWYASHVRFAYAHGLTSGGGSQTTFNPAEELTRGMLVTMLSRMDSDPQFTGDLEFTDLKQEWYTKAVGWAAEKGIVLGDGNGLFRPDDSITREQLVTILYRYAGQMGYNTAGSPVLSGYTDSDKVSAYAMEAMKWANAEGIMRGRTENTLVPQGNTSRAETMVILQRFIEMLLK